MSKSKKEIIDNYNCYEENKNCCSRLPPKSQGQRILNRRGIMWISVKMIVLDSSLTWQSCSTTLVNTLTLRHRGETPINVPENYKNYNSKLKKAQCEKSFQETSTPTSQQDVFDLGFQFSQFFGIIYRILSPAHNQVFIISSNCSLILISSL